MIMKMMMKMKNRSHRYYRRKFIHGHKYNKYKKCLSMMLQSSPTNSNSEGTGQKVRDSAIFEVARLRDSKIIPGENSR